MNIDLDNFDLIIKTINCPKEILIDLKSKLEEEIDDLEELMKDGCIEGEELRIENLKLKLQVVELLTNEVSNGY